MKNHFIAFLCYLVLVSTPAFARGFITLASTTSTENSGLYDALLPVFEAQTGIAVRVVAVGTGQALKLAENGDADLLIVHHRPSEDAFVAAGFGIERRDIMFNDYVLLGPGTNPADITKNMSVAEAFRAIAQSGSKFVSRGDDSGTHKKELEIWTMSGAAPMGEWYLDVGRGMGGALNVAAAVDAYILSDRATWTSFRNRGNLTLLFEGDPPLFNPYGAILVNPARHPHVKVDLAREFVDWLTSPDGQTAISSFEIDGQRLFFSAKTVFPLNSD